MILGFGFCVMLAREGWQESQVTRSLAACKECTVNDTDTNAGVQARHENKSAANVASSSSSSSSSEPGVPYPIAFYPTP
jgi:hypothetical protein